IRSNAVIIQARNNGERFRYFVCAAISSPIPLSISICLNAPPAAIINKIIAMLFTPSTQVFMAVLIFRFNIIIATSTEINKAIVGSCIKEKKVLVDDEERLLPMVPAAIRITGSKAMVKLFVAEGNCLSSSSEYTNGLLFGCILKINLGKTIPATTAMGRLNKRPYNKIFPISALKMMDSVVGPGCGGKKPCVIESEAAIGIPIYNTGSLVALAITKTRGINTTNPA